MKPRFSLLAAAALLLAFCAPAQGATEVLLEEGFSSFDYSWATTSNNAKIGTSSDEVFNADTNGWTGRLVIQGKSGLRLGTGAGTCGYIISPTIALSGKGTTSSISVTFYIAAQNANAVNKATVTGSVVGTGIVSSGYKPSSSEPASNTSYLLDSNEALKQTWTISSVSSLPNPFQLQFAASEDGRVCIDKIVVTETYSLGLTALDAPDNLAASNIGFTNFLFSWDGVSGVTGYSVSVKNANAATVFSTQCPPSDTSVSVTGLTPGVTYTAYVTALGDGTTNDDSSPAELANITTLSSVPLSAPTGLSSSNIGYFGFSLSWTGVSGATGYEVTLSPAAGSVSPNGTTATVTGLAEGATYVASVVAKGNGVETADSPAATLEVTTATAPTVSAPALTATHVSPSAITVSWPAQNDASFSARAWTLVPADVATENFTSYAANGTVPEEWVFKNSHEPFDTSAYSQNPVDFKNTGDWIVSPEFGGSIATVSFRVRSTAKFTGSFAVYGTTGSTNREDWVLIQEWERDDSNIAVSTETFSNLEASGFRRIVFQFEKTAGSGNIAMGSFSVTGTGVGKQPSYLAGYGPDAVAAGATSVTISNPVAGETNYVEVTATGLSGRTAATTLPVAVPAASRSVVISVK